MKRFGDQGHGYVIFLRGQDAPENKSRINSVGTDATDLVHTEKPTCELPIPRDQLDPLVDAYMEVQTCENLERQIEKVTHIGQNYFYSRITTLYDISLGAKYLFESDKKSQEKEWKSAERSKRWSRRRQSNYSEENIHTNNKFESTMFIFGIYAMLAILLLGVTYGASVVIESGLISMVEETSRFFAIPIAVGALVGAIIFKFTFPILFITDRSKRLGVIILFFVCTAFIVLWIVGFTHTFEGIGSAATTNDMNLSKIDGNHYFIYFMIGQIGMETFGGALIALALQYLYNSSKLKISKEDEEYYGHAEDEKVSYNRIFFNTEEYGKANSNIIRVENSRDFYIEQCIAYFKSEIIKAKLDYYNARNEKVYRHKDYSVRLYSIGG